VGKRKKNKSKSKKNKGQHMYGSGYGNGFGHEPELASGSRTRYSPIQRPYSYTREQKAVITEFLMGKFYIAPEVAIRFAEYARAAYPLEIGGFCRVQKSGPNNYIATDLMIFPQSATPTFWQMDGRARNKWIFDMRAQGREAELPEWNCLIHSHPNMAPFLSGTDEEDIKLLGHRRHAWSIIMSSNGSDILATNWAVHFFHGGNSGETPPLLVKDIGVDTLAPDWKQIHEEVKGGLMAANPSEYIGAKRERTAPVAPQRVITSAGTGRRIQDLASDDIPDLMDIDMSRGVSLGGIQEGSIVTVNVDPEHIGEFEDPDAVAEMVGEQFEVESIDENRGVVYINDTEFVPADLSIIQE
jgi:proteasome lid subunit RPN8/RPN11